uniref:Secreted protein n=1 Tax=Oryza sativa subsp. japonica TaxID=39947 RepID=Q6Z8J1_ORYSJ|nr:hypothetical protein [Oryza sativa Japonica Group]
MSSSTAAPKVRGGGRLLLVAQLWLLPAIFLDREGTHERTRIPSYNISGNLTRKHNLFPTAPAHVAVVSSET